MNHVSLIGNLTRDPELRTANNGTEFCNFGLAVSRKYKDSDETLFIDCTALFAFLIFRQ